MSDVKMPQLGETVSDGTVTKWFKGPGDRVEKGEALFEVSTDKVDTEIPAPASGVLSAILVSEGETVEVGTVLCIISSGADESRTTSPKDAVGEAKTDVPESSTAYVDATSLQHTTSERRQLSPVVRKLLQERGLDATDVIGTGPGGRVTKEDVTNHVSTPNQLNTTNTQSPVVRRLLEDHGIDAHSITASDPNGRLTRRDVEAFIAKSSTSISSASHVDDIVPFTRIRKLTADRMVKSKSTSAHTLMVREVDYEAIERARTHLGLEFKSHDGFSLTYLPFIAFAALLALRDFPHLNSSVGDNELIIHRRINLGIAVDLGNEGLVVPVIKSAHELGVFELARAIKDRATRARDSALGVDDFAEGTFTITNPGPFGTLLTGAIINQPQVAILSTDSVTRRPVVVTNDDGEESIAIHSMGLLALTFDHRAVDGAYAARFLQRVSLILGENAWDARL